MKKVVIASDSFKGSLASCEVARAVAQGVRSVYPDCRTVCLPIADGGEGTADAVEAGLRARGKCPERVAMQVCGPLREKVRAEYLLCGGTAVIESASACGLTLISPSRRSAADTTTFGLGELFLDAERRGAREIIVGLGGSATCDCGTGMLEAIGVLPKGSNMCGRALEGISAKDLGGHGLKASYLIACDVVNPLIGPDGAAYVFAPQKGAGPEEVEMLDRGLRHFAQLAAYDPATPGSGAAGGLGYALMAFLGARMRSGIDIVLDLCGFADEIADADLVITGEGRLDSQTSSGKAPAGVLARARAAGVPCIAVCGTCTGSDLPFDSVIVTKKESITLSEAMDPSNAFHNTAAAVADFLKVARLG